MPAKFKAPMESSIAHVLQSAVSKRRIQAASLRLQPSHQRRLQDEDDEEHANGQTCRQSGRHGLHVQSAVQSAPSSASMEGITAHAWQSGWSAETSAAGDAEENDRRKKRYTLMDTRHAWSAWTEVDHNLVSEEFRFTAPAHVSLKPASGDVSWSASVSMASTPLVSAAKRRTSYPRRRNLSSCTHLLLLDDLQLSCSLPHLSDHESNLT